MFLSAASLGKLSLWFSTWAAQELVPHLRLLLNNYPIAAALFAVLLVSRGLLILFPHRGTALSFADLTAKPGQASAAGRTLTAEILHLLVDPEPLTVAGLQMNTWPGSGQPAFGVVRPAQAMTPAPDFTSLKIPMKLAGVEFSLDDAIRKLRSLFMRPHREMLVGWLSCQDGSAVVEAALIRRGFRRFSAGTSGPWRATATAKDARERALKDIAAQILVDIRGSKHTGSWQSLRACQDGIRTMRQEPGFFGSGREARRCFTVALEHDSANWIARFYLALSLCGEEDGKPATALRHFQILDEVIDRVADDPEFKRRVSARLASKKSPLLRPWIRLRAQIQSSRRPQRLQALFEHLIRYPECPFILRYNIAIAVDELRRLSGPQDPPPHGIDPDPIQYLDTIVALRDREASLPGKYLLYSQLLDRKQRLELSLYAQSAQAHIMSMREDPRPDEDRLQEILESVKRTCNDARCLDRNIESWQALETTKAVALSSLARVLLAKRQLDADQEARGLLYEAIACEPRLVDAYLELAKLYTRLQESFANDWRQRADSLQARAEEMNPECLTPRGGNPSGTATAVSA